MKARPGRFSGLLSSPARDDSLRMLFAIMPAVIVLVLAAHAARHELSLFIEEARRQNANAYALARVNEADAHLRSALAAHTRYVTRRRDEDYNAFLQERMLADFGKVVLVGGQMALVHPEQAYRLRELDRATDALFSTLEAYRATPVAPAELQTIDTLLAAYRDREAHSDAWRPDALLQTGDNAVFIVMWIAAFASVLLMWALLVVGRNQQSRRDVEGSLQEAERTLAAAAEAVPALIGYADDQHRVRYANRALARLLASGGSPEGRTLRDLLGADTYASIAGPVAAALAGHTTPFPLSIVRGATQPIDLQGYLLPHKTQHGAVEGYFLFMTDISELRALERLKNEFASMVRHELRTPLTAIQGALGLVAGGATGPLPEKAHLLVNTALQSCSRLGQLVNDVFDSDAVLSGSMNFSLVPVDATAAARAAAAECRQGAQGAVEIRVHADTDRMTALADERRLRQVIASLCSNACNFSPAGSTVDIHVERTGAAIRISVADRGPGLPATVREKLFERYTRQGGTDRGGAGRVGLGLYLACGMLARMSSALAHRDREGGGTVFYFELPQAG